MKCVFDTNVLISALLFPNSVPRKALRSALERGIVYCSEECFAELSTRLSRRKFDTYLTEEDRSALIPLLREQLEFTDVIHDVNKSRDQSDNKFLSLAATIGAEYLITGDSDLLTIGSYLNISIIRPA